MQASHDHMAIGGWTRSGLAGCCVLAMAGCAETTATTSYEASRPLVVDGVPMLIEYDSSYMVFTTAEYTDPETGVTSQIEPIPTPAMLVVVRNDGEPTTEADRRRALQAAQHFCRLDRGPGYQQQPRFETSPDGRPVWRMGACE